MEKFNFGALYEPSEGKRWTMRLIFILTLGSFIFCALKDFRFFTGTDYSGHGFWTWAALWLSCAFVSIIVTSIIMWIAGKTPGPIPVLWLFLFGAVFCVLLVLGIPGRSSHPILLELGCGFLSSESIYLSLFAMNPSR